MSEQRSKRMHVPLEPLAAEQTPYARAIRAARAGADDACIRTEMELAAAEGDARANYSIATWFYNGAYGYTCNPELAIPLLRLAAKGDVREAMYLLGESYDLGKGLEADVSTAFLWFLQAALLGDLDAIPQVANCYASGSGVGVDEGVALVWYEFAERLGVDGGEAESYRRWLEEG